jgi:D-glycero-D-manno-heptose 1,7-bisphosphate phosphatase
VRAGRAGAGLSAVFLDRDGVINVKPPDGGYVGHWSEFHWIPAVVDWIRLFNTAGYLVIVVTNQRGVARGLVRAEDLEDIHARMTAELASQSARIDDIIVCPHEEGACDCRKPRPGLVLEAQRRWDIDLDRSLLIGDSESDRQLAVNCGLRFLLARHGRIVESNESASPIE